MDFDKVFEGISKIPKEESILTGKQVKDLANQTFLKVCVSNEDYEMAEVLIKYLKKENNKTPLG
jgi:hypothetical protein